MGLIVFHEIFLNISHIQTECGKYLGIFSKTLSIPQNIIMDLNNVMVVGGSFKSKKCPMTSFSPMPFFFS